MLWYYVDYLCEVASDNIVRVSGFQIGSIGEGNSRSGNVVRVMLW